MARQKHHQRYTVREPKCLKAQVSNDLHKQVSETAKSLDLTITEFVKAAVAAYLYIRTADHKQVIVTDTGDGLRYTAVRRSS